MKKSISTILLLVLVAAVLSVNAAAQCSTVNFRMTFKQSLNQATGGTFTKDIVTADFNRDGNTDFAVTDRVSDLVFIFLGNGNGGFTSSTISGGLEPRKLLASDFNRDGRIDLAVTSSSNTTVFTANAGGGFNISQTLAFTANDSVAADLNLDGRDDIITVSNGSLRVFLGVGNGTFNAPLPLISLPSTTESRIVAGDYNRDGKPDVAVGAENAVFVLPGDGTGGFGAITSFTNLAIGGANKLTQGDLNSDSRTDLFLVGFNNSNNAKILLGANTGFFTLGDTITSPTPIRGINTEDLNDDGRSDLAVVKDSSVEIRLNNGNNTFTAAGETQLGIGVIGGSEFADFNNDGKLDIVAADLNEVAAGLNQCGGLTQKAMWQFSALQLAVGLFCAPAITLSSGLLSGKTATFPPPPILMVINVQTSRFSARRAATGLF
jgi:hypothetical protein